MRSPEIRSTVGAVAAVLLAIVSVQLGAAFAKTLFSAAGPQGMTALRSLCAALILGAVWRPWRGAPLGVVRLKVVIAYGLSLGSMNLLFYMALQRLPLGLAVAIEFIGPFSLALVSSRRLSDFVWACLAMIGLAILLPLGGVSASADLLGMGYAAGAGASWALYIVFGQKVGRLLPGGRAAALGMVTGALVTLPFGLVQAGPALFRPAVLLPGLAVAILSSAIPYPLEMVALKRLPARTFGILMSLEPAVAALGGLLVLGESLSLSQWMAILCIVAASLGSTVTQATAHRP